jgi:hypothetical protein
VNADRESSPENGSEGGRRGLFNQVPLCEVCRTDPGDFFVCLRKKDSGNLRWKFLCSDCGSNREVYHVEIKRMFSSPSATVDLLAHLHEKRFMRWRDFMRMVKRFRVATHSFNEY